MDVVSLDSSIGGIGCLGPLIWLIGFVIGTHPRVQFYVLMLGCLCRGCGCVDFHGLVPWMVY